MAVLTTTTTTTMILLSVLGGARRGARAFQVRNTLVQRSALTASRPWPVVVPSSSRTLMAAANDPNTEGNKKKKTSSKQKKQQQKQKRKERPPKNPYADTILLPQTSFSQRANAITREPELQAYWKESGLYQKLSDKAAGQARFVLHDGPPYANGDLHCGHALNKILKDIINRYQVLQGKQVHYVPGWDCHGLPIELKVLQTVPSKERRGLTPVALRQKAAAFAQSTVQQQSDSFERYGIYGDFSNPYLTLQPEFEAAQIGVFGKMFQRGFIFRGRKPVHWSPSSQTALAEAELEYPPNHVSKSIYVAFSVVQASEALAAYHSDAEPLKVAIWTTTPWTIPANLAVAVNPQLSYSVVTHAKTGRLLVATDLMDTLASKFGLGEDEDKSFEVLATLTGDDLLGTTYQHPLAERTSEIVAGGDYITTESGTGLVHTAPGHGQEDYLTGLKYGLELLSPVDDAGRFTAEAGSDLQGLSVLGDGNVAVMEQLNASKALLLQEDYGHKYPYDWRTKKPTIFRATNQWFASVQGFRDEALQAIEEVQWVPAVGQNRITAFVEGRGDWCISRQRSWGVPIPVFYHVDSGEVLLNNQTLQHIQALVAEHGSDCWWEMTEADLLPAEYKEEAHLWKKGTDTMDVWFDSGSSWAGVAQSREELSYPADLYLEGSDQHRGWFQSSLLTSVATNSQAPYKAVLTHGFVLDERGFKMSKSVGNVVDPLRVIEGGNNKKLQPAYGADVLRLWVANSDYSSDVLIGDNILRQTFDTYRKLRNTARYMIGNLDDFSLEENFVPYNDLPSLDKYMLGRLSTVLKAVHESMEQYQFQRAMQELLRFATADLSNFYLDVAKDRLYISAKTDVTRRRSCQTVLYYCLNGLVKALAPVLPHMAEDLWQNLPYQPKDGSIFESGWNAQPELLQFAPHDEDTWSLVRDLRDDVNKCLEAARVDKVIGASLDAAAYIHVGSNAAPETLARLQALDGDEGLLAVPQKTNGVDELRTVLMISQVHLVDSVDAITAACQHVVQDETESGVAAVGVAPAVGHKCNRCWFYDDVTVGKTETGGSDNDNNNRGTHLCQRCHAAIDVWEQETGNSFVHPDVAAAAAAEQKEPVSTAP